MTESDMSALSASKTETSSSLPRPHRLAAPQSQTPSNQKLVLTPAQWIRAVQGVQTPFGYDRLPTVFG